MRQPPKNPPKAPNKACSMAFVSDQTSRGVRFRALTIVDVFFRECLAIEPGKSLKGEDVVRVSNAIAARRGAPKRIYCDNGSEFAIRMLDMWAYVQGVTLEFSRPGTPTDNAYIESFNGSLRDECLYVHWFIDLTDAKEKLQAWQYEYNKSRPHRALNNRSPNEFVDHWTKQHQKLTGDVA